MDFSNTRITQYLPQVILPALFSTLKMTFISMAVGLFFGSLIAVVLITTSENGLSPNKKVYTVMDFCINLLRSFPIIILIVAVTPLTRIIVGTSVGDKAAIVPLSIAAVPVLARIIENALMEVDESVILSAKSYGVSNIQIITKIMFKEALPSVASGITFASIQFLANTTLAGAVGAGGLGAVALTYGYQRFDDVIMYSIVLILSVLVIILQGSGSVMYKKLKR